MHGWRDLDVSDALLFEELLDSLAVKSSGDQNRLFSPLFLHILKRAVHENAVAPYCGLVKLNAVFKNAVAFFEIFRIERRDPQATGQQLIEIPRDIARPDSVCLFLKLGPVIAREFKLQGLF